jgi:hypothetical protein
MICRSRLLSCVESIGKPPSIGKPALSDKILSYVGAMSRKIFCVQGGERIAGGHSKSPLMPPNSSLMCRSFNDVMPVQSIASIRAMAL